MDPCKIIALSYHYIRCFVATATAISRNSGRRLNISLSLVPIATKVRPATHICFYTSPALVRAIARGLEINKKRGGLKQKTIGNAGMQVCDPFKNVTMPSYFIATFGRNPCRILVFIPPTPKRVSSTATPTRV